MSATVSSAFIGVKWGKSNYNFTIEVNGQSVKIDDKDIQNMMSENDQLRNEVSNLREEVEKKESEILDFNSNGKASENIKTDIINDITLIVDSTEVTGRYIGVAKNGELLLSTKALEAFCEKSVTWDAQKNTVYVGDKSEKPAIEVKLWEKNRIGADKTQYFLSDPDNNAFGFALQFYYDLSERRENYYKTDNYIVYPLNAKAKKLKAIYFVTFIEMIIVM